METVFRIHPELRDYIRHESEEENAMLEQSLLSEGCRDPLVVWKEEGVLVDGHHRLEICERHGIPYTVKYQSFPDAKAAKAWMRKNQLARRNLDKTERDVWIREMRAEGWTQQAVADELGITKQRVGQIEKGSKETLRPDQPSPRPAPAEDEEKAELRRQVAYYEERARQDEKIGQEAKKRIAALELELEAERDFPPQTVERVVEKPSEIDREIIERLADQRAASKIAEAEERMKAAAERERELDEDFNHSLAELEEAYSVKEKALEATKRQMTASAAAKLDVEELEKQKRRLETELSGLRTELDAERADAETARRFRKFMKALEESAWALAAIKEQIAISPRMCGLTALELAGYVASIRLFRPFVDSMGELLDGLMQKCGYENTVTERGLHIVEN